MTQDVLKGVGHIFIPFSKEAFKIRKVNNSEA